jgi:hypothetical protein
MAERRFASRLRRPVREKIPNRVGAAPARVVRSHAPGRRRGSARGYYGPLPGAGLRWSWVLRRTDARPGMGRYRSPAHKEANPRSAKSAARPPMTRLRLSDQGPTRTHAKIAAMERRKARRAARHASTPKMLRQPALHLPSPLRKREERNEGKPGALSKPGGGALARPCHSGRAISAVTRVCDALWREPESITTGRASGTQTEQRREARGYGFRSRRLRAVPE